MSLYLKNITREMKQPFILFISLIAISILISLSYTSGLENINRDIYINVTNSVITIVTATAIISSFMKFNYLLSESKEQFKNQGVLNKTSRFFIPLIGELLFCIIIDLLILSFILIVGPESFRVKTPTSSNEIIYYAEATTILLKYFAVIGIFLLHNLSINYKMFIAGIAITLINLNFIIDIFSTNFMPIIIICIIFIVVSYLLYLLRVKYHQHSWLRIINYSVLISFLVGAIFDSFITKPIFTHSISFTIGGYVFNIIPLLLLISFAIRYSYKYYNKVLNIFNLVAIVIIPLISGSIIYNTRVYLEQNINTNQLVTEEEAFALQFGTSRMENYIKLNKLENSSDLLNELKSKTIYKLSPSQSDKLNSSYLETHKLTYVESFYKNDNFISLINENDFNTALANAGITTSKSYVLESSLNNKNKEESSEIFVISETEEGKQAISKSESASYLFEYNGDSMSFITSKELYKQLNNLDYSRYSRNYQDARITNEDDIQEITVYRNKKKQVIGTKTMFKARNEKTKKLKKEIIKVIKDGDK